MKAMVMREFGPPEVMRLEETSTPQPGSDEVLIRVHAVSVNRTLDLAVRAGTYPASVALPHVLGVDPSGVVDAVGPGVTARTVGDRVVTREVRRSPTESAGPVMLGVHTWGGYAEYVKVPVEMTHAIPEALDFATATVVARHGPTALSMLRDYARVQPGEWVLVMGASGGLGSAGVQVARDLGALAGNGRLITAGAHGGGTVSLDVQRLYLRGITVIGSVGRASADDVARCLRAAADGRHRVLIDRVLPLAEAALAHRIVAQRSGTGKVVLQP